MIRLQISDAIFLVLISFLPIGNLGAQGKKSRQDELTYPPKLPDEGLRVSDTSRKFLVAPGTIRKGIDVARTAPTVEFMFYPGQNYPGKPWSNWGDSLVSRGKYYSAIGDHLAVNNKGDQQNGTGTAFVFEYDPETKGLRNLADLAKILDMPKGHYTPGKIHTRIDMGSDGWLYYSTHRGSIRATTDAYHYRGDWILRTHPVTGKSEVVAHAPIAKHAIPNGLLDPENLIYYGGTAAAYDLPDDGIRFFAYDIKNKKLLYSGPNGPARYMMLARTTGRLYFVPGKGDGELMRFDPKTDKHPVKVKGSLIGIRAATRETADGHIYTVSLGQRSKDATIWSFNTKTEKAQKIGNAAVGSQAYVASLNVDPTGRFLYYVPGAHGGSPRDGSAVIQFDIKTGRKKVIAFLDPFYTDKYGFTLKGTYGTAIAPDGDKLYITWNVSRGSRAWDCCGLTVIHIPESERATAD